MSNYCKRRITIVSLIITIFIYILINLSFNYLKKVLSPTEIESTTLVFKISKINPIDEKIYK